MNARQINGTDRQQTTNKQTDINLFSFTDVSLSVRMQSFYKHILTHCNQYETLDLVQSSKDRSDLSPTLWDINLMIDLAQSVFEPMTIPKLSRIICMIQENYHVIILAIPIYQEKMTTPTNQSLSHFICCQSIKMSFFHVSLSTFLFHYMCTSRSDKGRLDSETMSQSQLQMSVRDHQKNQDIIV